MTAMTQETPIWGENLAFSHPPHFFFAFVNSKAPNIYEKRANFSPFSKSWRRKFVSKYFCPYAADMKII